MTAAPDASCRLPTPWGELDMHAFTDAGGREHLALGLGRYRGATDLLLRVHSECMTGDIFRSLRCDCHGQLVAALDAIAAAGRGLVLYLRQEGRGIGLLNKMRAYNLQDQGMDTVEANEHLGFAADCRDYSICKPMLDALEVRSVRLMTNNMGKVRSLAALGIRVRRESHRTASTGHNSQYLATKAAKLGHLLES